jgi:thioredoxin 1
MKKTLIISLITAALFLAGGLIIAWSVYQKEDVQKQVAHIRSFTDENFEAEVVQASKKHPVLVEFYADWCFPCRMLDPILTEVAKDLSGRAVIGKLNTDKNLIARRFGISRIPAVFIIRDGEIKNSFFGVVPKETIVQALREYGS